MFVGISDEWHALFVFKLFISFSMSVSDTVLKEKLKLHFPRIALILGIRILRLTFHHRVLVFGKVNCLIL